MIKPQWDWAAGNFSKNLPLVLGVVVLVAIGVGISVAALSVLGVITQDPIPQRSDSLFFPTLDPRPKSEAPANSQAPRLLSWTDARNVAALGPPDSVVLTAGGRAKVGTPGRPYPEQMNLRYANAAFFLAFDTKFASGSPWSTGDDDARARSVALSLATARRLFGTSNAVGRQITLDGKGFTVIGVLRDWQPKPRFYDLSKGGFNARDDIYLPISTALDLRMPVMANIECWGGGWEQIGDLGAASCGWISTWAYLPTASARATFLERLGDYASMQHELGRFELPPRVRMQSVRDYLSAAGLVTKEVALQTYLALGLLLVCLINASALLLSLSLRKKKEFALRRALGAARSDITIQALFEGGLIGVVAGLAAALLAMACLEMLSRQPTLYSTAIHVDVGVLVGAVLVSVLGAVVSSLFPAWVSATSRPSMFLNAE
jgi:putative ABC transport system permease protein